MCIYHTACSIYRYVVTVRYPHLTLKEFFIIIVATYLIETRGTLKCTMAGHGTSQMYHRQECH